ncbi:MAG: hypothetical protein WCP69_05615 [Bacteroidota bacterium]
MKEKTNISRLIYISVFFSIFILLKELSFLTNIDKTLVSGLLGGIGVLFGIGLYELVKNKKESIKYIVLVLLTIPFIVVIVLNKRTERNDPKKLLETYLTNSIKTELEKTTKEQIETKSYETPKLTTAERKRLITCEVCGFKAVCPDSDYCYNCRSSIFSSLSDPISEKMKWLRNEQLFWFCPDTIISKIDFSESKSEDGFKKDPKWKPSVTKKEVLEYYKKQK